MYQSNNSQAQAKKEHEVMTFQFSESENLVRTLYEKDEILFVGSDVAKTLGYKNVRDALRRHCKGVVKRYILTNGGNQKMNMITEGDVFRLIIHSELESAQKFESWIMDEVLPSLRKKGYYSINNSKSKEDYLDARAIPHYKHLFNGFNLRCIKINEKIWVSVNDLNKAIHSSTSSNQLAKKLNAVKPLAKKIWIFGNTHPAWFTNELGVELILAGSRKLSSTNQLTLDI